MEKVYVKIRENGEYHSPNFAQAVFGFKELGAEIIKYKKIEEIYDIVEDGDIVIDYIDQTQAIFRKFGIDYSFDNYPEVLSEFLGRKIWKDKINNINSNPDKWNIFVKPIKEKAFTGKVIREPKDLIGCGSCYENYDVLCSDIVDIKREWRCFYYYGDIIDIRPYKGDYHYHYDANVLDEMLKKINEWEDVPYAFCIDIGVTADGKTILIECNDCYSLGSYGLYPLSYAKMIAARWAQLYKCGDDCYFGPIHNF